MAGLSPHIHQVERERTVLINSSPSASPLTTDYDWWSDYLISALYHVYGLSNQRLTFDAVS
jgi:hypothetical protein